jgi:hypothetical protein
MNFKQVGKLGGSIAIALATSWQTSIPTVLLVATSTFVTAEVVHALEAMPVTVVNTFGWDSGQGALKILIQLQNGDQYYLYYPRPIDVKVGSLISVTYTKSGSLYYFNKVINTGNSKESSISRQVKSVP